MTQNVVVIKHIFMLHPKKLVYPHQRVKTTLWITLICIPTNLVTRHVPVKSQNRRAIKWRTVAMRQLQEFKFFQLILQDLFIIGM